MKKGFTLIELLAVIVILAIIAVIAVPIVLNIIDESKESATLRSAEMYIKAAELSIVNSTLKNKNISNGIYNLKDGNICLNNDCSDLLEVEVNGSVPKSGTITIIKGAIFDLLLSLNEKTIVKNTEGKLAYLLEENQNQNNAEIYMKSVNNLIAVSTANGKKFENGSYELNENGNLELGSIEVNLNIPVERPSFARFDIIDGNIVYFEIEINGEMFTTQPTSDSCFEYDGGTIYTYEDGQTNTTGEDMYTVTYSVSDYNSCLTNSMNIAAAEYYNTSIENLCAGNYEGDVRNLYYYCDAGPGCGSELKFLEKENKIVSTEKRKTPTIIGYTCEDKNIIIPYGTKNIGNTVFDSEFETITFPSSIEVLDKQIFLFSDWDYSGIEYILVPNSIKNISYEAFLGFNVRTIYLGNSITSFSVSKNNFEIPILRDLDKIYVTSKNTNITFSPSCDPYNGYYDYETCMKEPTVIVR